MTKLKESELTTDAVTLVWEQPESRSDYSYVVQVTNGSFPPVEEVATALTHTISGLLSGTNYSFTVTTQTADGTPAAPVTESFFTRMRIPEQSLFL